MSVAGEKKAVSLKMLGSIAALTGVAELAMEVDGDFRRGMAEVKARVDELTEGKILYHMAYNGISLARVDAEAVRIQEGDQFVVLPVVLGG